MSGKELDSVIVCMLVPCPHQIMTAFVNICNRKRDLHFIVLPILSDAIPTEWINGTAACYTMSEIVVLLWDCDSYRY